MKRAFLLLTLSMSMATVWAQSYNMIIHVDNGTISGFPNNKISIPVDKIHEVTFEETTADTIEYGDTPITFRFKDYSTHTRSPKKAPALGNRKYGVFASYNNGEMIGQDNVLANLMFNKEVKFINGGWSYSPIVYWPENNTPNNYASFFAYSPYAENGNDFVRVNDTSLEPVIDYIASNPQSDEGDLLYGSLVNATKYDNNGCVIIESKHALARLNINAVVAVDQVGGSDLDSNTKVTIKKVEIDGFPTQGSFDLTKQQWIKFSPDTQTYTIEGDNLSADLRDAGNKSAANQPEGVKTFSKPVGISPFMFIPQKGREEIRITIEYYITTDDPKLAQGYARTKNVIQKTVILPTLHEGYSYNIRLILGLTSVKIEIEADSTWGEDDTIISI